MSLLPCCPIYSKNSFVSDEVEYTTFFERFTRFKPYEYQLRVASALLAKGSAAAIVKTPFEGRDNSFSQSAGSSLVISAPTGAGKTWAVLIPFIYSRIGGQPIADRLLYALPLRSLADSLYRATHDRLCELMLDKRIPIRREKPRRLRALEIHSWPRAGLSSVPSINCYRVI